MEGMTQQQIDEIKARANKATPGAWKVLTDYGVYIYVRAVDVGGIVLKTLVSADAEFIANARADIPALLAEVERLKAENAKAWREVLKLRKMVEGDQLQPWER